MYPYIVQGSNIVVVIGNVSHTVSKTHPTYDQVLAAIKASDWEKVKEVIEPKKMVLKYAAGNVTIEGEKLFWKGQEFNSGLASRMITMLQEGFPIEPMVLLMENLMQNPSQRSVRELYGFLEKSNLPVTPDGHFLAFKKVRANYFDVHSGTMDNSVGKIVEMERNMVDDDKDRTCSSGLHFCSLSYLAHFAGERTVIVKINPRDVVSIPSDYNNAKGRTCRYEVIDELDVAPEAAFTKAVQKTAVSSKPAVNIGPKKGSTPFYRGYTDGYTGEEFNAKYRYGHERQDYNEGFDKGEMDNVCGVAARYEFVVSASAVAPTRAAPVVNAAVEQAMKILDAVNGLPVNGAKKGSTSFYRGYTDGYTEGAYNPPDYDSAGYEKYEEGFDMGGEARDDGKFPQFVYVAPVAPVAVLKPQQAWPFPVNNRS
jgi:hypothetical protein